MPLTIATILAVFIMSIVDSRWHSVNKLTEDYRHQLQLKLPDNFEFVFLRYGLLLFFTAVWTLGDVILTPELKHHSAGVSLIHVVIIVSLLTQKTAWIAGVGMISLWCFSAYRYGFFHLSDYTIFLGIAIFMIISSIKPSISPSALRFAVLYSAISITLQWASIEKFVYPQWTYPILDDVPHLSMGMDKVFFMNLAGYIEFILAFMLISMTRISFLIGVLGLAALFIIAIIDFGKIDAIGHSGIIVSLIVLALRGPSKVNQWFATLHSSPLINAFYVTLLYVASLTIFFLMYYGIRYVWLLTTTT
ncbi:MAG: hypothetical protein AAFZ92_00445 [Pseudomonadota bacterium]